MKHEKGSYQVTRNCCRSGCCVDCHATGNVPTPESGRTRIIQADGYSKSYAEFVAGGWKDYAPKVEPMEPRSQLIEDIGQD